MGDPVAIGVSACLLGENVRYNGGQKHDSYITGTLGKFFALVPVCPEVESGMSVPREPMRLEGDPSAPRLMTIETRIDKTGQLISFSRERIRGLEEENLSGFIFKKRSPSCGPSQVKVHNRALREKKGVGLFAQAIMCRMPLIPCEDEERLGDPGVRENFIERVFSYRGWSDFLREGPEIGGLVEFHARHKLLIMAHSPSSYREMGRLVARCTELEKTDLFRQYGEMFMKAMAVHATISKHTNVLLHILGYFKKDLRSEEKAGLVDMIGEYRAGLVPLLAPLTMLRYYARMLDRRYLAMQVYLNPSPAELFLRNHP
jgi:uncharacterized protein YbgA (DUF1722 family)/uncharacterized protein YbbK (DUF523 family)